MSFYFICDFQIIKTFLNIPATAEEMCTTVVVIGNGLM